MKDKKEPSNIPSLIIFYGHFPSEGVSRHIARSLIERGHQVSVVCLSAPGRTFESDPIPGVQYLEVGSRPSRLVPGPLSRLLRWRDFRRAVGACIEKHKPGLVVTVQFHALAAIPQLSMQRRSFKLGCSIWAIPSFPETGRLDRWIIRQAVDRLKQADVLWASDSFMAQSLRDLAGVRAMPGVCHVGKPLDFLPPPTWPRDPWLRNRLRAEGASLGPVEGCVVLRAGAVGPEGGIEETFQAMEHLPKDIVFVLLGRPSDSYCQTLERLKDKYRLEHRVFIWPLLADSDWKRCLQGADVGHLIHTGRGVTQRAHALNSALSTVRLFNYMAAGLPIVGYDDPRLTTFYQEVPCVRVARLQNLAFDLRTILGELSSEPSLREKLGRIARHAHESKYNWEHQFAPILDAITRTSQTPALGQGATTF